MTDSHDFDAFLADALAPPDRDEDRAFVLRVEQRIRIEEALRSSRAAAFERLWVGLGALAAMSAALLWLVRSADVAAIAAESPAATLALLAALFLSATALMAPAPGSLRFAIRANPAT